MRRAYDCIVIGGHGAFGSQAAYHLSRLGASVLAIDRHPVNHKKGSSHGQTRITRLAYFEGAAYVPFLRRSLEIFKALQERSGVELFKQTGMLDIGSTFASALSSARQHNLPYEVLDASEVMSRFPGYHVPPGLKGLLQPDGGILRPEAIISLTCSLSAKLGVDFVQDQCILFKDLGGSRGVEVKTASGSTITAGKLLVASGPWIRELVPQLRAVTTPVRQVVGWFDVSREDEGKFDPSRFPVFVIGSNLERRDVGVFYGFPQYGEQRGFKIGLYNHLNQQVDPETMDRGIRAEDEEALRKGVCDFFPLADRSLLASNTCLFTNTPDANFIIDHVPSMDNVMVCSACSGHGFKLSSGVGELVASMILDRGQIMDQDTRSFLDMHQIDPKRKGFEKVLDAFNCN